MSCGEACAVISRAHVSPPPGQSLLAVDERGRRCEPLSPAAVAWTSVGALYVADPVRRAPEAPDTHGRDAWEAFLLLERAAKEQGHGNTVEADRAGSASAQRMFWQAMSLDNGKGRRR